jgi:Protein of unknown function (DUF2934)
LDIEFIETLNDKFRRDSATMRILEQVSRIMARKSNPEKEIAATGAAPAKPRRSTTTTARPRRSSAAAKKPVAPVEDPETETVVAVSALESAIPDTEPSRDAIARLAYLYWLDRGGQQGSAEEDWLRAEHELRQNSENMQ